MEILNESTKLKICKTCGEQKPLSGFSGCGVTPDRLQPNCKPCHERRQRAGLDAANVRRTEQKAIIQTRPESSEPTGDSGNSEELTATTLRPIPYPSYEDFQSESGDHRSFCKRLANIMVQMLNEQPNHPSRKAIEQHLEGNMRIADIDDTAFMAHRFYEANPINKLDQDEKLHCIRSLPVQIVKKLFPNL